MFGGSPTGWGFARKLDGNGAHLEDAIYNLQAGETYQLSISGRSTRFNLDRIIVIMDSERYAWNQMQVLPESSLFVEEVEVLLGDMDQSGNVNFADIAPFISTKQTGEYVDEADCNQDDVVDFLDINAFIDVLLHR